MSPEHLDAAFDSFDAFLALSGEPHAETVALWAEMAGLAHEHRRVIERRRRTYVAPDESPERAKAFNFGLTVGLVLALTATELADEEESPPIDAHLN